MELVEKILNLIMSEYPAEVPVNEAVYALAKSIEILTETSSKSFDAEVIETTSEQAKIIEIIQENPEQEIVLPEVVEEKPVKKVKKIKKESWTLDIQEDALEGFDGDLF